MTSKSEAIDAYILKANDFAKPILEDLRNCVHKACPEIQETLKWGFPHFLYQGQILCSMASFKSHCAFSFWQVALMHDPENILDTGKDRSAMGHLGKIEKRSDLPSKKILTNYINQAKSLIDAGAKIAKKKTAPNQVLVIPSEISAALKSFPEANKFFKKLSYSHQKEYIEWITEAKTEPTKLKRLKQTIEWLEEGKSRNWKYKS